jgi:competence protein ComEA
MVSFLSNICNRRDIMKFQKAKIAFIVLCILISGICYSVSRFYVNRTGETNISQASTVSPLESQKEKSPGSSSLDTQEEKSLPCYVHICGEVVFPGVYQLSKESRIFEAVEKAGGFTQQASPEYLNMAQQIEDGMKIVVLSKEEAKTAENQALKETGQKGSKINLNTAPKEELMTLRGIGEARAEDIIKYRDSHGAFKKNEDIMNVSGIKDAAFQKIKDDITI